MTTTVTVSAHCNPETTEVRIELLESNTKFLEEHIIQDGESKSFYVYDERRIIKEIPKQK